MNRLRQGISDVWKLRSALLFWAALAVYQPLFAATINQWRVSPEDLKLNLPVGITNNGSYSVEITRKFANEDEAQLLKIAEATYPSRDVVLQAAKERPRYETAESFSEDYLWWSGSFDGVRGAFAITGGAVDYYLRLTDEFRSGVFKKSGGIRMSSSGLKYSAVIELKKTFSFGGAGFQNVYIVSMKLSWSQHCGDLCAMRFTQQRTVILNEKGEVLMVSGDKKPSMAVS
jgi:hypothetical protein